ncbi:MAG: DUF523 domain-containing protein [Desulfobulbus sp.]|nr:DUF523 domain-containing protein [Desulfobulbus sp.]
MNNTKPHCLVSACLIGLCTRYDGQSKANPECVRRLAQYHWSPVCPEQLGGMPTPRTAAEIVDGDGYDILAGRARVVDRNGVDCTGFFLQGARMVLDIAQMQHVSCCLLKSGSPSCGLYPKIGVTSALLREHGIEVIAY